MAVTLWMAGMDYQRAGVALREQMSFSPAEVTLLDQAVKQEPLICGAALLSTCNRTELYVTAEDGAEVHPGQLLCQCAGRDWSQFAPVFVVRQGEEAARHLLAVAAGLQSQILGEDQIVTQVGQAMERARQAGTMDGVLSTLFQTAVAAGKEVKTQVRLTAVPRSVAAAAVDRLRERLGGLAGRRAVVIGNGQMGRLTAQLLQRAGCAVTVTLRTYRHGETVVPFGCETVPYLRRMEALEGADLLVSATTSPHFTLTRSQAETLTRCPPWLVDLAMPRDLDPALAQCPGVTLWNLDDFDVVPGDTDPKAAAQTRHLLEKHLKEFYAWWAYRDSLPAMEELKAALGRRFEAEGVRDAQPIVDRTVELMLGGLKGLVTARHLRDCADKISAFTRPGKRSRPVEQPFRFPVFTDLCGKRVVVVGGGAIARRRLETLRPFGPELVVIAPTLSGSARGLTWLARRYQPGDLEGAVLAVAATDDRAVNRAVGEEAHARGIPVSVADRREECSFYFPAICAGDQVLAGVVSRGEDHRTTARAAKQIRTMMEEQHL